MCAIMKTNMLGIFSPFLLIFLVFSFIYGPNSAVSAVKTCKTDNDQEITGWDWEVRNGSAASESYFINICGQAENCGKLDTSVCKKGDKTGSTAKNYGASVTGILPTMRYGKGFSITFTGTESSKPECENKKIQTKINFQCDKILGSPELVDDDGCMVIIEFYTKEACNKSAKVDKIKEIPCVIYNKVDKKKRDLSPLIKLSGGHRVSSESRSVEIFINVCRDITFDQQVPTGACGNDQPSPACRIDKKKPIGKITSTSKLYYDGDKIKLVYNITEKTPTECPKGVTTDITFLCKEQFSNGGAGPILITNVDASPPPCHYDIIWGTGHACANNDILTQKCKFTNGEVSFDLTKLEKPKKELSYRLTVGEYEYRLKVCSNGQPCGSDLDGAHTAVCQIKTKRTSEAYSCGNADDRSVRYADGDLTMVYKGGSPCKTGIHRRTIITFRCDPAVDIGEPTFVIEDHCYYYFEWKTRHVCPSRKAGACSVVSKSGDTYDLSILTKNTNNTWLAVNDRKKASGYTYYINVCGSLAKMQYRECHESAACEVKDGKGHGIGMYKTTPTISKSGSLSLIYTGGKCPGFVKKNITTIIKFICKNKDLESPPELESKSWDGCDYVFAWATAAACSLQVTTGKGCFLEDSVTGNVYDLSPLAKGTGGKDYFTVTTKSSDEYYIKICSKEALDKSVCGQKVSAGICQKTKSNTYIAGKVHGNMYYYDGVLKLPFTNGDKCHNQVERKAYITFFCSEAADLGKPVFVGEIEHCLYNFAWYTKYACPMKTMVCVVKDSQGNEYDLSPLVKTDGNWVVTEDEVTYYINICRVLHQTEETSGCPSNSSACMRKVNGTVTSIGEIVGTLTTDGKSPVIQYQTKTIRTMITFSCNHLGQTGEPTLDSHVTDRLYSFTWDTKEACRIEPKDDESGCNDKDTRIYLLKTPDKKGYTIPGPDGGSITLGICQNITCGDDKTSTGTKKSTSTKKPSTACFTKNGVAVSIGRSAKSTVEHGLDVTTLTYLGGDWKSTPSWGRYYETRINFVCTPNVTKGKPEFIEQVENVYIIEFKTSVVCKSVDVSCVANSQDKHYDLNPLTLTNGNWMAEDTRLHLDYYINVCSGYFPGNAKYQCQGSAGIGGCQVDSLQNKANNMGYVMSGPVVSSAGHLTLRYLGGETCHHRYDRSTRINFFCSDVHGSPVFMAETEDCEYVFNWKTPSACSVEVYRGANCTVYDENYGFYYDLSSLTDIYSYVIEGNIEYKVRFCGKSPTTASCGKDVDSCRVIGKTATDLLNFESMKYHDGKVVFTYKSKTFTVLNEISCDPKVETISAVGKTEISAGYNILWTSKLVCPPVTGEECSITHERDLYDLSVLAKEEWNWLARNNIKEFGFKDYQFHFSVCKPLKNIARLTNGGSRGAMENKISGAFTSLGTMIAPLKISNGYLTMTYGHGDEIQGRCKNPTTTIQFVCDDVVPEGVGVAPVVDGFDETTCEFHVTWLTRAACPVRSLLDWSNIPCTAIHPATKKTIDLRPLNNSKDGHQVKDQDGNPYKINVCGSANGCPKNSGICKIGKPNVNVGSVNTTLVYRQGFLFLHYKNGENCEGQQNRKTETLISFMCDPQAGNGKPTLERTNDCTHFVTWKTKLACEAEVDCVAHDGQDFYDLTPLIKNDANYEVVHLEKTYLINVCRSLVSGSRCPANAAVCKDGESFGHVSSPPKIVSGETEVKAQLVYKNGRCGDLGNTIINFHCDPKDLVNKQIIVFADKCSLNISWWTSLVCPKKVANNNCVFSDPEQKFCFDLKKLGGKKSATFPGGDVHFHVCSDHGNDCKGAHGEACLTIGDKNIKALSRKGINYTGQEVRILYDDDIVLVLYCGEDGNSNTPQYIGKHKVWRKQNTESTGKYFFKYFFNMVTPEVCPPRKLPCEVKYDGKTVNLAGLSEKNFQVKGKDNDYFVSICGHIQYTTEAKICSSRATAVKISREKKEQSTIVIAVDRDYQLQYQKTDKDYPIHLQYSSSEASCDGKKAKVLHKFKCNHGTNPPQFDSFKDCVYTFLWQTAEACPEKRTPLKRNGDDWTFYDDKSSNCELDLIPVKNKLKEPKYAKYCELGNNVEVYAYDDKYELTVNCTTTSKIRGIDITLSCGNDSEPTGSDTKGSAYLSLLWATTSVCHSTRTFSCSKTFSRSVAKSALAVIGTLTGIGLLAAILFFACKPQKRETAALWLRWHIRKYICCKPSYQASYRYKKVNTDEEDGETGFIIEAGAGSLFSDDSDDDDDDDNHSSDDKDDDDLLPLDDDLLNLEE